MKAEVPWSHLLTLKLVFLLTGAIWALKGAFETGSCGNHPLMRFSKLFFTFMLSLSSVKLVWRLSPKG